MVYAVFLLILQCKNSPIPPYMNLRGTGVALVTPFKDDFSIDYDALGQLIEDLTDHGADYLVVLGTTGEAVTLTEHEREEVAAFVALKASGKLPMVLGVSGNATANLVSQLRKTNLAGYDAILSVMPFYNKPSQEGAYRHFSAIAEASPVPVILYNVPSRTGSNLDASTTLRLAHDYRGKIIGIKEASGKLGQIRELIEKRPDDFEVVSGDDALTLPLIAMGAVGIISVVANGLPGPFTKMVNLCLDGRFHEAAAIDRPLQKIYRCLFAEGNPAGIKCLLSLQGKCEDVLRLPLVPVSEGLRKEMARLL